MRKDKPRQKRCEILEKNKQTIKKKPTYKEK